MPMLAAALPAVVLVPLGMESLADGFYQSVPLVFVSEIGDKTFFLSAIIAMREGRSVAFAGSMAALTALTGASVGIGQAFKHTPDILATGLPMGDILATTMFTYFGLQMLREARLAAPGTFGGEAHQEAEEALADRRTSSEGAKGVSRWWPAFAAAFSLVFVAEVGDKSMFATIALARDFGAPGVFTGAVVGHSLATGIAVLGGSTLSAYVSQATVSYIGGTLFLVFAGATTYTIIFGEEADEHKEAEKH